MRSHGKCIRSESTQPFSTEQPDFEQGKMQSPVHFSLRHLCMSPTEAVRVAMNFRVADKFDAPQFNRILYRANFVCRHSLTLSQSAWLIHGHKSMCIRFFLSCVRWSVFVLLLWRTLAALAIPNRKTIYIRYSSCIDFRARRRIYWDCCLPLFCVAHFFQRGKNVIRRVVYLPILFYQCDQWAFGKRNTKSTVILWCEWKCRQVSFGRKFTKKNHVVGVLLCVSVEKCMWNVFYVHSVVLFHNDGRENGQIVSVSWSSHRVPFERSTSTRFWKETQRIETKWKKNTQMVKDSFL